MTICPTCGRTTPGKPRSVEAHRRYFKVVSLAFEHWPENHREAPFPDLESFRAWVQMRAGHYTSTSVELDGDADAAVKAATAALRAAGSYARARVVGDRMIVYRPSSVAFSKLSQSEFNELSAQVEAVIKAEAHLDAEELLKAADGP